MAQSALMKFARQWLDSARKRISPPLAVTYLVATITGYIASLAGIPLPWMLGPFFAIAACSLSGLKTAVAPMGRELGQVAIGLAVGLRFTPPVLLATLALLPAMAMATLYIIAFTLGAAFLFKALAHVDDVTAFFATAAGGVADMATVSQQYGGAPASVAIVHALRVSTVVAVVPFVVFFMGEHGAAVPAAAATGNLIVLSAALVFAYLAARLLKPTPLPNPWLVGPILAGMILGLSGVAVISVPAWLIIVAQVMLGAWLGSQFQRGLLVQLPRVSLAGLAVSLFMVLSAALGAVVLSAVAGLPYATSFLALAPAAVTEMVITAKVMNLDAETVTAFHIMRIAVVSSTVLLVFKLFLWMRRASLGPRL